MTTLTFPSPLLDELLRQLPWGFALSVLIETLVLLAGLSKEHSLHDRLLAGFALTLCTYPLVAVALPLLLLPHVSRPTYLWTAEPLAAGIEALVFATAFEAENARHRIRNMAVVVLANVCSFLTGEWLHEAFF